MRIRDLMTIALFWWVTWFEYAMDRYWFFRGRAGIWETRYTPCKKGGIPDKILSPLATDGQKLKSGKK